MTVQEMKLYDKLIPSLDVIIDVGVQRDNVFYELNPKAEIHLFEPNTSHYEYLADYYKDKDHNVLVNNYALSSEEGFHVFYHQYGSLQQRIEPKLNGIQGCYVVETDTLDAYCQRNGILKVDYLKIDAEGHDFEVIKGSKNIIRNTRFIQFEDFITFHNGEHLADVFKYFTGWNIYKIGGKPVNYLVTKDKMDLHKVQ